MFEFRTGQESALHRRKLCGEVEPVLVHSGRSRQSYVRAGTEECLHKLSFLMGQEG